MCKLCQWELYLAQLEHYPLEIWSLLDIFGTVLGLIIEDNWIEIESFFVENYNIVYAEIEVIYNEVEPFLELQFEKLEIVLVGVFWDGDMSTSDAAMYMFSEDILTPAEKRAL